MSERAAATTSTLPNGRVPNAAPIGVSGVAEYGGIVYHHHEYLADWRGTQRDRTIQSMLNDPLVGSILLGIEMLVRRVDWTVQAADDSDAAIEQAEFVSEALADMEGHWPGDTLAQILTFLGWGWSCMEITYKRRDGIASRHDDGRIGWDAWSLRPQLTRYGWDFDGDRTTALVQEDPLTLRHYHIPLDKCLLFRYASRDNSPEGFTPLRVAYKAWYYKEQIQKIEAIGIERDLAGMPVMYIPGSSVANQDAVYHAAQRIVTGIRNDSQAGAVLPSERDDTGHLLQELTLLSTGGQRSFDTNIVVRRYANEIVTAFLANVLRTGQDGIGALALSETQAGLFQQAIGAHLDTIADTITEQAILSLVKLNGMDQALAPTLKHGDIESADLERLGAYLVQLASAGMLEDTPELRAFLHEVAGLPVPAPDDMDDEPDEPEDVPDDERDTGGDANDGTQLEADGDASDTD